MAAPYQVTPPQTFKFSTPGDWPKWSQRFERFRNASGLNEKGEESQINTLIYCMGDEANDILRSFGLSKEDKKKYDVVKGKFDAHFDTRKNVIFERAKFNKKVQVDDFITALYSLVEHCNYGALREETIWDRIVVGVRDDALSLKLQMNGKLILEEAVTITRQNETVKKQQIILRGQPQAQRINTVRTGDQKRASGPQKQNSRQPSRAKPSDSTIWFQNARDAEEFLPMNRGIAQQEMPCAESVAKWATFRQSAILRVFVK